MSPSDPTAEVPPPGTPSDSGASVPPPAYPSDPADSAAPPPKRKRRIGWIITVVLLALALIAAAVVITLALMRLEEANTQIDDQQDIIDEQEEIIDTKETFGAAMRELVATAAAFEGVLFNEIVPQAHHVSLANRGWDHRWDVDALEQDTAEVIEANTELAAVLAAGQAQAASNATGTTYESVIDSLGGGFATISIDDADALCSRDVLACVSSDNPYVVHYDAPDTTLPYMTDWIRTGLSYHEFAHVLQFTNPVPTETAVAAFGGDVETMADCFALTFLDGWTLDHTVWVSSVQYWEVSVGYGYVCDEGQRQVIRDWRAAVGYHSAPITQE